MKAKKKSESTTAKTIVIPGSKSKPDDDHRIRRGSFSRLSVYETCPRRAYFAYVERAPENPRPPLEHGKEYPNDRGDRVHKEIEAFVKSESNHFPREAKSFEPEILKLRDLVTQGQAQLEETWYFDDAWRLLEGPKAKDNYTYQVRLDASVFLGCDPEEIVAIDFKTGKRFGNEVKHADQTRMYAMTTFLKYPEAVTVHTELHYLDHNELSSIKYNSAVKYNLISGYTRRFDTMFTDRIFRPRPNAFNCSFCPYKTGNLGRTDLKGTGHCKLNP